MVTNNVTAEFVIRVDRRRCPYRPTQMSASVDADQNNATITMFPQRDC
ncbi:hypothetical protein [Leyella stercorea]|nr:hypothetical protein [Leyella stercorea]